MDAVASGSLWSVLLAGLAATLGLLGGWLGAYAKVKGEHLATREDFDEALRQLRQNTQAVEDVKQQLVDRSRRIESSAHYVERQIQEFYGPIFNLLHQIVVANHVQHAILAGSHLSLEHRNAVIRFFQERYFFPVHREVNEILKTKLYLIRGTVLPDSYYKYLRHALQEQAQAQLWQDGQIDTSYVAGMPYPNEIYSLVKRDLDFLMARYEALTSADDASVEVDDEAFRGREDLA